MWAPISLCPMNSVCLDASVSSLVVSLQPPLLSPQAPLKLHTMLKLMVLAVATCTTRATWTCLLVWGHQGAWPPWPRGTSRHPCCRTAMGQTAWWSVLTVVTSASSVPQCPPSPLWMMRWTVLTVTWPALGEAWLGPRLPATLPAMVAHPTIASVVPQQVGMATSKHLWTPQVRESISKWLEREKKSAKESQRECHHFGILWSSRSVLMLVLMLLWPGAVCTSTQP